MLPETLIQGTETHTQQMPVRLVRINQDGEGEGEGVEPQPRVRKASDPTPGGILDNAVPGLLEHCRADESKSFMPFFPPGRMLHLQVENSKG